MVKVKFKRRFRALRADRRRRLTEKDKREKFIPIENPEELFVGKLELFPSIYNRHSVGLYIKGDGTLEGATVRLKEFATAYEAENFKKSIEGSVALENIKIKMFAHLRGKIFYNSKDSLSNEEYDELYPQLKKYRDKKIEGMEHDWFEFLKDLGFKEEPVENCCMC